MIQAVARAVPTCTSSTSSTSMMTMTMLTHDRDVISDHEHEHDRSITNMITNAITKITKITKMIDRSDDRQHVAAGTLRQLQRVMTLWQRVGGAPTTEAVTQRDP